MTGSAEHTDLIVVGERPADAILTAAETNGR
jgi:hypothetical protein